MIISYRDRETERMAAGEKVRQWDSFWQASRKAASHPRCSHLVLKDARTTEPVAARIRMCSPRVWSSGSAALCAAADLGALNSNRLKALEGDRKGQYSIRINGQWRICFEWPLGAPGPNAEIVDDH